MSRLAPTFLSALALAALLSGAALADHSGHGDMQDTGETMAPQQGGHNGEMQHNGGSHSMGAMHEGMNMGLHVGHSWARASMGENPNSAGYVTIHNPTDEDDRLIGISCAGAANCQVHNHVMEGDVSRMVHLESLEVPAGAHLAFGPGGLHIMMFDLKERLEPGAKTEVTLTFEKAGPVTVSLDVLSLRDAAKMQAGEHGASHGHDGSGGMGAGQSHNEGAHHH